MNKGNDMTNVTEFMSTYGLVEKNSYERFVRQEIVKDYFSDHEREIKSKFVKLTAKHDQTISGDAPLVMSGFMQVIHIGTLTVEDGGYISLLGNGALIVDKMDIKGEVGQPFMIISGPKNEDGKPGQNGANAVAAPHGVDAVCDSPGVSGPPGSSGGTGGMGGVGTNGLNAPKGGEPIQMAVTFSKVTGAADLAIINIGVKGGNGGNGGVGGNGGNGGNGGAAKVCGWENSNGGDGGNGGNGGNSGNGGNGGSATVGGDLTVKIHQDANITVITQCMIPKGGAGAIGGMVGIGGTAGLGGQYGVSGKAGSAGNQAGGNGQDGEDAAKGKITITDIKPGPPPALYDL